MKPKTEKEFFDDTKGIVLKSKPKTIITNLPEGNDGPSLSQTDMLWFNNK